MPKKIQALASLPHKAYTNWFWFGTKDKLQLRQCPDKFWITYTGGLVEITFTEQVCLRNTVHNCQTEIGLSKAAVKGGSQEIHIFRRKVRVSRELCRSAI